MLNSKSKVLRYDGCMRRRNRKPQVYAFIDSQNLNVTTQKLGWKMDWRKFREHLTEKYGVTKALMFIGYVPEFEDMYVQLHDTGYAVVLKPTFDMTRPRPEVSEKPDEKTEKQEDKKTKGNIDADLVLWAMKEIKNYDKAVIVSGDGDFYSLVEYLEQEGKLLKLLAPSGHYSGLYNAYDKYVDRIDQSRKELAYHDRKKHKSGQNRQPR
jgi:uncharacterized LabA/DUF88 family protein